MSDLIKLLSDAVANQIAAGEVIQRPASVIKELVENAIDAGATEIQIQVKDAGKTFIQIIDNGCGMSQTDARMCFERHATSKISKAEDLFAIKTMGFRGEALASIAAIASVELKTKTKSSSVGTHICISGSEIISQEPTACPVGTNFLIKNLFYNVPARRKFLKSDRAEYRHILNELHRIILTNPEISFTFVSDGNPVFQIKPENLRQRIVTVFGKNLNQNLISINTVTSIVNVTGFIAKPERSKNLMASSSSLSIKSICFIHTFEKQFRLHTINLFQKENIPHFLFILKSIRQILI